MDDNLSPYWRDFLEDLQSLIPSIDSDSSSLTSENDDVMIFPQPTTLPAISDVLLDENKILESNANVKPKSKQKKGESCAPVLSFSLLDGWDLDDIIQNLKRTGPASQEHEFHHVLQTPGEADNQSPEEQIMERLVSFSRKQSARLTSEPAAPEPKPIFQSTAHSRECSVQRNSDATMAVEMSRQESPTVYIDLRHKLDPSGESPGTCQETSVESKTEAKYGRRQGGPPETSLGEGGQHNRPRARSGRETGMSMLLRNMREHNKRRDGTLKGPSFKLETHVEELTEKTSDPVDPARRQGSRDKEPQSELCGSQKTKETEISVKTSITRPSKHSNHKSVERSQPCTAKSPSQQCATNKADLVLLVSPAVAPRCWGGVLSECAQRGFTMRGVQRLQLPPKTAKAFGLTSSQVALFCKSPNANAAEAKTDLSSYCLVLLLKRQNAMQHCMDLPTGLMRELEAQNLLGDIGSGLNGVDVLEPGSCFHISPYTDILRNNLCRCMRRDPTAPDGVLSRINIPSDPKDGQVVILSLCGQDLRPGLTLLHRLLSGVPGGGGGPEDVDAYEGDGEGFELLDLTWLPALTWSQAQELSPYEVGERLWPSSLDTLGSSPALVCCLFRVDAFTGLRSFLLRGGAGDGVDGGPGGLSVLMSPTPELAFRQARLFFSTGETAPQSGFVSKCYKLYS